MFGRFFVLLASVALLLTIPQVLSPSRVLADSAPPQSLSCTATPHACVRVVLKLINADRATAGMPPLQLQSTQSAGVVGCAGSIGHSLAMARSGAIWHTNKHWVRASFPNNMCVPYRTAGENTGESSSGNVGQDLVALNNIMMQEPHARALCAGTVNHACNLLSGSYRQVGIGVVRINGVTWLTEDFIG